MKNMVLVTLLTLLSTASIAYESQIKMNCGSPQAQDGTPLVGVGYEVSITYGFDTHARNDQGGFGKSFIEADLISTVVAPGAQPETERLTLRRKTSTNYYFSNDQVKATVNRSLSAARVLFIESKAVADCKTN